MRMLNKVNRFLNNKIRYKVFGMKTVHILALFILTPIFLFGQVTKPDTVKHVAKQDTINPNKGNINKQLDVIKEKKIKLHSDSISVDSNANQPHISKRIDTVMQNKYGDLLK